MISNVAPANGQRDRIPPPPLCQRGARGDCLRLIEEPRLEKRGFFDLQGTSRYLHSCALTPPQRAGIAAHCAVQAPRLLAFGALFLLLGAASLSCGKKGPPIVPGSVIPEAVTDLEAAPHGKNVSLAWTKPRKNTDGTLAVDISGFIILRGEVPPSAKGDKCECEHQAVGRVDLDDPKPGEVEGNRIRFEDRGGGLYPGGLPHGRTYSYKVAAVTKRDYKGKASKAVVVALDLPPGPPSGLSAAPGEDTAALTWTAPPSEAGRAAVSGYLVFRTSEREAREIQVSPEPVRDPAYTDLHLSPGLRYTYSVAAVASARPPWHAGERSASVSVVTIDKTPPSPPQGLKAEAAGGRVRLSWSPSPEEDTAGYHLYRSDGAGGRSRKIATASTGQTTYEDKTVRPGVTYVYTITAFDRAQPPNESPPSSPAKVSARRK